MNYGIYTSSLTHSYLILIFSNTSRNLSLLFLNGWPEFSSVLQPNTTFVLFGHCLHVVSVRLKHYPLLQAWGLVSTHSCSYIRSHYRIKTFPWHTHACTGLGLGCVTDRQVPTLAGIPREHHKPSLIFSYLNNFEQIASFIQLAPFSYY